MDNSFTTQLNQANPQATYSQNGNKIIGSWNQQATASGALGSVAFNMNYSVEVQLNQDKTYSIIEHMQSSNSEAGLDSSPFGPSADQFGTSQDTADDGGIKLFSSSSDTFSGKTFGNKQKGFNLQFGGKPGSNTVSYDFDASKIKQPLIAALQAAGYSEQKKSFFKKLLGK